MSAIRFSGAMLVLLTLFLTFKKTIHFLCLLLDAGFNISTSHFTSAMSVFEVILQLTRYTNYLLTYLLIYLLTYSQYVRDTASVIPELLPVKRSFMNLSILSDSDIDF